MTPDPDARLAALGGRQHGVVSHDQALACGLSPKQVKVRVAAGRLRPVTRGVHAFAGTPDTWQQRAMAAQLAVARAGGVASHVTAAALHGLLRPSPLPHVTVPPHSSARCPIAKVHRSPIPGIDRATVAGIRTTSVSRTLVDLATVVDRATLEEAVDDALSTGLASMDSVARALERAGRRRHGATLLDAVLRIWTERIEPGSPAEVRLLRRLEEWGIPAPATQHEVRTAGGELVARVDVAWPESLVALEYLGRLPHGPRRTEHDERRRARLVALGWRVAEATKVDLLPGEQRLVDQLGRWLGVRQGPDEGLPRTKGTLAHAVPSAAGLS